MAIATDGVNVYWVAQSGTAADAPGQVLRCPVNGCNDAPETVATKADAGLFAQPAIAVDATNVYWVSAGAIMKRAK